MSLIKNSLLSAGVGLLMLLLGDGVLGWMGFPSEYTDSLTYGSAMSLKIPWLSKQYEMSTNHFGIRYPEIELQKPKNETRVLVLGDSFVEGQGVEASETFSSQLEHRFSSPNRRVRFINAGIAGAGPYEYSRILYRIGLKYQPNLVLVVFYANDVENTPLSDVLVSQDWPANDFIDPNKMMPPRKGARIIVHGLFPHIYTLAKKTYLKRLRLKRNDIVGQGVREARALGISEERIALWRSKLPADLVRRVDEGWVPDSWLLMPLTEADYWVRCLDLPDETSEIRWNIMKGLLSKMVRVCRARQIPILFAYAPIAYQYDANFDDLPQKLGLWVRPEWLTEDSVFQKRLEGFALDAKIPYLDMTDSFRNLPENEKTKMHFDIDTHWTARGHAWAAKILEDWLLKLSVENLNE